MRISTFAMLAMVSCRSLDIRPKSLDIGSGLLPKSLDIRLVCQPKGLDIGSGLLPKSLDIRLVCQPKSLDIGSGLLPKGLDIRLFASRRASISALKSLDIGLGCLPKILDIGLGCQIAVEKGDMLVGKRFRLLLGKAAIGQALDKAVGIERDRLRHEEIIESTAALDKSKEPCPSVPIRVVRQLMLRSGMGRTARRFYHRCR